MFGHIARIGDIICLYRVLVGKHEGTKVLGRTRLRRENNIQKYFNK